jgi:hypothetical protein
VTGELVRCISRGFDTLSMSLLCWYECHEKTLVPAMEAGAVKLEVRLDAAGCRRGEAHMVIYRLFSLRLFDRYHYLKL